MWRQIHLHEDVEEAETSGQRGPELVRNRRSVTFEGLHAVLLGNHVLLQPQLLDMVTHVREVDCDGLPLEIRNLFQSDLLINCVLVVV